MIKNYLLTAIRNIRKNGFLSLINFTGITLCFICIFLIFIYCLNELSYDRFNSKSGRIYRIFRSYSTAGGEVKNEGNCPAKLADDLKLRLPHLIEATCRLWHYWGLGFNVQNEDKIYQEKNLFFADNEIFDIFDLKVLEGNPETALQKPNQVVITETTAAIYFDGEGAIGKSLKINNSYDLTITAIISDLPRQSHLHFNFIASFSTLENLGWQRNINDPDNNFCYVYLLAREGCKSELKSEFDNYCGNNLPVEYLSGNRLSLQKLTDVHLANILKDEIETGGSRRQIIILISIAVFLLLITAINYINLSISSCCERSQSIALHKINGASQKHIICQFMLESLIICTFSLLTALAVLEFSLPHFSRYAGIYYQNEEIWNVRSIGIFFLTGYLISILISIYPALLISRMSLVEIINNKLITKRNLIWKKVFVIIQLMITTILIISSLILSHQVAYLENFDVNYDKDNIIILSINNSPIASENYETFIAELKSNPSIENATGMRSIAGIDHITEGFSTTDYQAEDQKMIPFLLVRDNFISTFGLELIAGRDFISNQTSDRNEGILINERYVKLSGWTNEEAIGKNLFHSDWGKLTIIGIIKDFNFESLRNEIKPLVIKQILESRYSSLTNYLAVRISSPETSKIIQYLQQTWEKYAPENAFEFIILKNSLAGLYEKEKSTGKITIILTYIAIITASLGLLGLMLLITEKRTREAGNRKSQGATSTNIILLILKDQLLLVLFAFLIAVPTAWIFLNNWLSNFAYKIKINVETFMVAGLIIFFICVISISVQIIKTTLTKPVKILRNE